MLNQGFETVRKRTLEKIGTVRGTRVTVMATGGGEGMRKESAVVADLKNIVEMTEIIILKSQDQVEVTGKRHLTGVVDHQEMKVTLQGINLKVFACYLPFPKENNLLIVLTQEYQLVNLSSVILQVRKV